MSFPHVAVFTAARVGRTAYGASSNPAETPALLCDAKSRLNPCPRYIDRDRESDRHGQSRDCPSTDPLRRPAQLYPVYCQKPEFQVGFDVFLCHSALSVAQDLPEPPDHSHASTPEWLLMNVYAAPHQYPHHEGTGRYATRFLPTAHCHPASAPLRQST